MSALLSGSLNVLAIPNILNTPHGLNLKTR